MPIDGAAQRLTVFVSETDRWHHRPVYAEIVARAHRAGLAGAAVFRGIEGYGAHNSVHTSRILSLSENLPVAVVIIDTAERITDFVGTLEEVVGEGLAVVEDVHVMRFGRKE